MTLFFVLCLVVLGVVQFLKLEKLMTTQAQIAEALNAAVTLTTKIGTEVQGLKTRIAELTAALEAAGNATPEVQAALAALQTQLQAVDDLVPDAEPEPEQPAE